MTAELDSSAVRFKLRHQYGPSSDWSMDKIVDSFGYRLQFYDEGGEKKARIVPIKSVEELKELYQLNGRQ